MALTLDSLVENFLETSGSRFMEQNDPQGNLDRGVLLGQTLKQIEADGGLEADVARDLKANAASMSEADKDALVDRIWDRIAPTRERFRKYHDQTLRSIATHFNRQGQAISPEDVRRASDAFRTGQDNSPLAIVAASAMNPANYTDEGFQFPIGYLDEVYRGEPLERAKIEDVLSGIDTEIRRGTQKDFQSTQSLAGRALPLTTEALSRTSAPDMVELHRQKIEREVRAEAGSVNSEDAIQAEIDRRLNLVANPGGFAERAVEVGGSALTDLLKAPDRVGQGVAAMVSAPPGEILSEGARAISNTGLRRGAVPGVNDPISEGEQASGEILGTGISALSGGLPAMARGAVRTPITMAVAPSGKASQAFARSLPGKKVAELTRKLGGENVSMLVGGRTSLEKALQQEQRVGGGDMFANADVDLPLALRIAQGPGPSALSGAVSATAASAADPNSDVGDMAMSAGLGTVAGGAGGFVTQRLDNSQPGNLYEAALYDQRGFVPNNATLRGELARGERSLGAGERGQQELDRVLASAEEARDIARPQVAAAFADDYRTGYKDRTYLAGDQNDPQVALNPQIKTDAAEPSTIKEATMIERAFNQGLIDADDRDRILAELQARGRYGKVAKPGTVAPEETTTKMAPMLDAQGNPIVGKSGIPLREMQTTTTPERVIEQAQLNTASVPFTSDPENYVIDELLRTIAARDPRKNPVSEVRGVAEDIKDYATKVNDGVRGTTPMNPKLEAYGKFEQTLSAVKEPQVRERIVDDALSAKSAQGAVPDDVKKSVQLVTQLESLVDNVPWQDKAAVRRALDDLKDAVQSFKTYMIDQADIQQAYKVWAEKLMNPANAVVQMLRTEKPGVPVVGDLNRILSSIPEIYAGKQAQSVSAEYSAEDENKLQKP